MNRYNALTALLSLATGFGGSALADVIDGFNVTFNPLPTVALNQRLPDALTINGSSYTPADLVQPGTGGGFSRLSSNPWGATNPFQYSPSLNGSVYNAIWNGVARYDYSVPQSSLSILWGTIDASNALTFTDPRGAVIGTIQGSDLAAAAAVSVPGYTWAYGVDITVDLVNTPFMSVSAVGGPSLTMEYANLTTASIVPEPSSLASAALGLTALAGYAGWRRAQRVKRGQGEKSVSAGMPPVWRHPNP